MRKQLVPLIQFGLIGVLNTGIDVSVFLLLTAGGVPILAAQCIGYSLGIVNSYLMNRRWTFRGKGNRNEGEVMRFVLVNLLALALSSVFLVVLHEQTNLNLLLCKLIATIASIAINYGGSQLWVFGSLTQKRPDDN